MKQVKTVSDDSLLNVIIAMVKGTPNDMELGSKVRQLLTGE